MAVRTRSVPKDSAKHVRDLIRLFDGLVTTHETLLDVIREKLSAMRRADMHVMREMTVKEQALARTIQEREGLRRQLMDAIGAEFGLNTDVARAMTVSQLATRLPLESGSSLQKSAESLRLAMHKVAQSNRVAGTACREVINHMKWLFASVRPKEDAPTGYGGNGAHVSAPSTKIFEVVG